MERKTLANTNLYLRAAGAANRRMRSLASSTAIETGEPVARIEQKIRRLRAIKRRTSLA